MFHRSNIWQYTAEYEIISISDYRYTRAKDNKSTLHNNKQYNTWVTFANDYGHVIANVDHLRTIFIVHSLQKGIKFCILDFVLAEKNNEKCQNWRPAWNFSAMRNKVPQFSAKYDGCR